MMRPTIQQRNPLARDSSTGRTLKIVTEVGHNGTFMSGSGSALGSPMATSAATAIRDSREREKKEMSDLNDKLANYIEKVRFLEAQNRKLDADLAALRGRWGKDTESIRQMYQSELTEAKRLIDETNGLRKDLERQLAELRKELKNVTTTLSDGQREHGAEKEKLSELLLRLSTIEAEIAFYKRRVAAADGDIKRLKNENQLLLGNLQRHRTELDQETLNRIDYQNQVQTLLEEIEFLRRVHEQEIHDLRSAAARDTTPENREFFKSELSSAIREIRDEYDQMTSVQRTDMESWYRLKIQEIQTQSARQSMEKGYAKEEVKRLRVQLTDLRVKLADLESKNGMLEKQIAELNFQLEDDQRTYEQALNERDGQIRKIRDECQTLMVELQMLLDTKQTLDAEIALYRKMLDGEDTRPGGVRNLVTQALQQQQSSWSLAASSAADAAEAPAAPRTSYQRSAKGNVSIQEISADGHFVVLMNSHRSKEEKMGEWKLRRRVEGSAAPVEFQFPKKFVLRPGKSVKICARGWGANLPPEQLVDERIETFGVGPNAETILVNKDGDERATFIQKSS